MGEAMIVGDVRAFFSSINALSCSGPHAPLSPRPSGRETLVPEQVRDGREHRGVLGTNFLK